jgi:hypothetical protein
MGGGSSLLSAQQAAALKAWVSSTLPKSTRQVGAWIAKEFGLVYESRSGLIALLHRLGLEYHKPEVISRKLDEKTQKAFIAHYDNTLNSMGEDEVAVFVDAVHTTHAARPVGCWAPAEGTEPRDRADERAPTHQHPWRGRPGNGQNPDDRGRNDRRDVDDPVVGIAGSAVSVDGLHPRFLGQRALSPRQTGARMVVSAGLPDQASLPPALLPALEPDRAAMGGDASKRHVQQMLRHLHGVRRRDFGLPARRGPQEVGRIQQFSHRQFPYNLAQEFSASRVNRV